MVVKYVREGTVVVVLLRREMVVSEFVFVIRQSLAKKFYGSASTVGGTKDALVPRAKYSVR